MQQGYGRTGNSPSADTADRSWREHGFALGFLPVAAIVASVMLAGLVLS